MLTLSQFVKHCNEQNLLLRNSGSVIDRVYLGWATCQKQSTTIVDSFQNALVCFGNIDARDVPLSGSPRFTKEMLSCSHQGIAWE